MMGRRAYARAHRDRVDAGGRQAPLRPQGGAERRRRRPAADARALRHAAALAARASRSTRAGDALVEIPLNDSLTSFRIAAVATGGDARFGTGEASIRTTQELMILAGLPPFVREGDRFAAGFTLRNTTDDAQERDAARDASRGSRRRSRRSRATLQPASRASCDWDVEVPAGVASLDWQLDVESAERHPRPAEASPSASCRRFPCACCRRRCCRSRRRERIDVERPAGALPDRGGLDVALRPRLADGRDGIDRAMREYPYACLEQQASIAIALRDAERWRSGDGGAARRISTATASRASSRSRRPAARC